MAYADIGKNLLKYLPMIAILYAGYQYYAGRGFQGFLNDVQAITLAGIEAKAQQVIMGFALILAAPFVAKYVPNASLKHIVKAVMYYVGASQLFQALRSGAGYGGQGSARGFVRMAAPVRL